MHSPGHRANLLNPRIDRIGVAVVASRGVLYAVADYERTVQSLTTPQVEARVDALIRESGVSVLGDPSLARAACATDEGVPHSRAGLQPSFVMRWQGSELTRLPQVAARSAGLRPVSPRLPWEAAPLRDLKARSRLTAWPCCSIDFVRSG